MTNPQSLIEQMDRPPEAFSDDEIDRLVLESQRLVNRIRSFQVRLVAEAENRRFYEAIGFGTAASWLRSRLRSAHAFARNLVTAGRALREMPLTAKAFDAGDVDLTRVRRLTEARKVAPEEFAGSESMLVDAAREFTAKDFATTVAYWKQVADPGAFTKHHEELYESRHMHVSRTWQGMWRLDGWLDPESGAIVMAALGSYVDTAARDRGDTRAPGQVRADALTDICRFTLDNGHLPVAFGERPHILVTADVETLEGRANGLCELAGTGPITPEAARRLACDAKVARVITDPQGLPLEVGRSKRTATIAQRRALIIRDGGCVIAGCHMPPQWTDAHHIDHWADGGSSDISNYVLLCRRHHRAVHAGTISVPRDRGRRVAPRSQRPRERRGPPGA